MPTFRNIVAATCFVTFASSANGQHSTGEMLLEACETQNPETQGFCLGWIIGLNEGLSFGAFQALTDPRIGEMDPLKGLAGEYAGYCFPDAMTYDAMTSIFVQALTNNAAMREATARAAFQEVMAKNFPCDD